MRVLVGRLPHPAAPQHYISHIFLLTDKGASVRCLPSGSAPEAMFSPRPGETVTAAYALCSIHGLWKTEVRRTAE